MSSSKKKTPPRLLFLSGNEGLIAKRTDPKSGESFIGDMNPLAYYHEGPEEQKCIRFLSWNGENFAWKEVESVEIHDPARVQMCSFNVSSRTGVQRATVHPMSLLATITEVYGITETASDGIWRPASITAAGRPLMSVSGVDLRPAETGSWHSWSNKGFHRASLSVVKVKTGFSDFHPVRFSLKEATNVVLACGMIQRTDPL